MNRILDDILKYGLTPSVTTRAMTMSIVVGTILVGINHGYCIWTGHYDVICLGQSLLTYLVPYSVSTLSSVLAISNSQIESGCTIEESMQE